MAIVKLFRKAFQYLSEGVSELFSPNHDKYPNVGVQPFDGEPLSKWVSAYDRWPIKK